MTALVTVVKDGTRFFLNPEGLATDILSRANPYRWSYDAQRIADLSNTCSDWKQYGFHWSVAHRLDNGELSIP